MAVAAEWQASRLARRRPIRTGNANGNCHQATMRRAGAAGRAAKAGGERHHPSNPV